MNLMGKIIDLGQNYQKKTRIRFRFETVMQVWVPSSPVLKKRIRGVQLQRVVVTLGEMVTSMRRFMARPFSVEFEANGRMDPYPTEMILSNGKMPLATRYWRTASARCCDKCSFIGSGPVLSV
jgi:hypothetical protein